MSDEGTPTSTGTNRRGFLQSIGTTGVAGGLASILSQRDIVQPVTGSEVGDRSVFDVEAVDQAGETFPQSVASGGPTDSGVILWTRIAPSAVVDGEPVGLQVATDADFEDVVHEATVGAENVTETHDYTVKIDLDGQLDADRFYHYRFTYDGVASRTGRCRTLPAPDASPDELSFAVLTCQDYQNGYYGAYHHLAEEDVDFVVHLGDFIYESADGSYTSPLSDEIPEGRDLQLPSGNGLAESLADFRYLYRQYKGDSLLQAGLEQHTFIHGWDDHEIGNNRYWNYEENAPGLPEKDVSPERSIEINANGIQAWVEYIPARVEYDPSADSLQDQLQLWRQLEFGDLVDLAVTDERLFRDGPPCDGVNNDLRVTCTNEEAEGRTMLGDEQKAWWESWVSDSGAIWTTWANEVLTMPLTAGDGWDQVEFILDSWDGFQYERWELMDHLKSVGPRNFVTLTGDLHAAMAGYQWEAYGEIDWQLDYDRVGVEFMTPSVTSVNAADVVDFPGEWDEEFLAEATKNDNEHVEFVNYHRHGYAVIEFTRDDATFTVYEVDTDTNSADAQKTPLARYRTPDGETTLEQLPADMPEESSDLADGVYKVRTLDDSESNQVLDVSDVSEDDGADVHLWEYLGNANQQWEFTRLDDGTYRIEATHSGKVLDVESASSENGANIHQWEWHGGGNQRWYVDEVTDGEYRLVNKESGKVADCQGGTQSESVHQWEWHGGNNQRWHLEQV